MTIDPINAERVSKQNDGIGLYKEIERHDKFVVGGRKSQRKIFLELFLHQAPTPLSMWAAKRQ